MSLSKLSVTILVVITILSSLVIIPNNSPEQKIDEFTPYKTKDRYIIGRNGNSFQIIEGIKKVCTKMRIEEKKIAKPLSSFNTNFISQLPGINPSVVTYGKKVLIVYEHPGTYRNITMQYSEDYGKTWSNALFSRGPDSFGYPFERSNQSKPDIAIRSDGHAICVFESDDNTSRLYMLEFPDITNSLSWNVSWIELYSLEGGGYSYRIENLHDLSIDISGDKVLIAGVADVKNLSSDTTSNKIPVMFYSEDGGDNFIIIFSEDVPYGNVRNTSVSFDEGAFVTYQLSNGILCLYFPDGNFYEGWEEFEIEDTDLVLYRNPSVYTKENTVIIALESISNGNSDICYFYSGDLGSNWLSNSVSSASTNSNERCPSICYHDGKFLISFERNGNLYVVNSTDMETWSEPERVNSVDGAIYPYFGFSEFGNEYGIVWSEIDGDNLVIKFSNMKDKTTGNPDESVDILLSNISLKSSGERIVRNMKNVISLEIENAGSADSGPFLVTAYILYRNSKDPYPVAVESVGNVKGGEKIRVNLTLFYPSLRDIVKSLISFVNIDSILICVDSDNSIDETNEDNNNITLNVNYGTFFPKLVWLENLVLRIMEKKRVKPESIEETISTILSDKYLQ